MHKRNSMGNKERVQKYRMILKERKKERKKEQNRIEKKVINE